MTDETYDFDTGFWELRELRFALDKLKQTAIPTVTPQQKAYNIESHFYNKDISKTADDGTAS
ncbi:hypothetical protein NG99_22355 [Erwinia typographi]|uniref:Uncharacterized protein n=1 Tax=Erwinia typographi TaxID=371042 RepID=A0A0A3YRV3_9GAMM|nr:hypothetical protein [Erwinia typographi]KGT88046.1 hypothetical protein NG99_22355 [Erwinia typographi]